MKESDIRPAELFTRYLELSAADARTYFGACKKQSISCPACASEAGHPSFEKWDFSYVLCETCGTLYQSPRPHREIFERFYLESPSSRYWAKTFFPSVAEARRKLLFRPKVEEIARLCRGEGFWPDALADVGAGYGLLLEEWRKRYHDSELIAIEPNPDLAEVCRSKELNVVERFAEEASSLHEQVDLVVALEVIEHVHDPYTFCTSLRKLLRNGGRLLLTGLTVDGFDIQVLWENSKSISPPHHLNFMSIKGFQFLLNRSGYTRISIFTPGKLDVDIVENAIVENQEILQGCRFLRHLMGRDHNTLVAFQNFLSENQLSSHCWIWAEK